MMRTKGDFRFQFVAGLLLLACSTVLLHAQSLELVSKANPNLKPPAGGGGDSHGPVISADGRFVLFASTANNLVQTTNNTLLPAPILPRLNVFLRDRTNGTTTLVSVNHRSNAGGNGDSVPTGISADNRYVVFESDASDLVEGDTNKANDVFVRDLAAQTTILVSCNTNGVAGNRASRSGTMTPDGRFLAFVSEADDLVAGDTNSISDVFIRDLEANTTALASVGAISPFPDSPRFGKPVYGRSEAPVITPDGRFVVFYSTATNLTSGVPPGYGEIYVRDLRNEATIWASMGAGEAVQTTFGSSTNAVSFNHAISDDGQVVAYEASAYGTNSGVILRYHLATGFTDVVHNNAAVSAADYADIRSLNMTPDGRWMAFVASTNSTSGSSTCVLVWDAQTGTTTLASADGSGNVQDSSSCDWPVLTWDGRFVAFLSDAHNLVTNDLAGEFHLYVRDLQANSIRLVDVDTNGVGSGVWSTVAPQLSSNGRLVAFDAADGSLVAEDRNRTADVFVRDVVANTTELVSVHHPAFPSMVPNGSSLIARQSVSYDGRFVAIASEADDLADRDANRCRDIFLCDLEQGTVTLVSVATNGMSGNSFSSDPAVSADGRFVAFTSNADDLVPGDTNKCQDVFVRDLQTGITQLVSVNSSSTSSGNGNSYSPTMSADGSRVLFRSTANNLTTVPSRFENLYLRDLAKGTTYAVSRNGVANSNDSQATMSSDGHIVIYVGFIYGPGTYANIYVWDAGTLTNLFQKSLGSIPVSQVEVAISASGRQMAFSIPNALLAVNLESKKSLTVETNVYLSYAHLRLDAEGHWLSCSRVKNATPRTSQVALYDWGDFSQKIVSHLPDSDNGGNGDSGYAVISEDGRFVAYESEASDLVANDTNSLPDILLYDQHTGVNTLITAEQSGEFSSNNRSQYPVFSGDGRALVFAGLASGLTPGDFNQKQDLYAYKLLYGTIVTASGPDKGIWLSWPSMIGKNYRVQYKDRLEDPEWQNLGGAITNSGNKAWIQDNAPSANGRLYRIGTF